MIAGVLGGNAGGARIGADRQLGSSQRNNPPLFKGTHDLEEADDWWVTTRAELDAGITITWAIFKREFLRKYFPEDIRGRKEIEFLELKQDNMTVPEYAVKFAELAKYYTPYNNDEAGEFSKCTKLENGLYDEIKQGIRYQRIRQFVDLVDCSRIFEEDNIKMKSSHSRELVDRKGKKHMDRGKPYGRGKAVDGKKPSGGDSNALVRCYNCGEMGHRRHECKLDQKKCFKCDKVGHIAADCKKKTMLFPEAVSANDLNMTARQVNEAIKDSATIFMFVALMNLKEKVSSVDGTVLYVTI
ncbi:uncharacterized protein LOC131627607 [Vicia villosa]|uniref:uncharacterized protein LOC131627607 n=1 Tax=Vicia villosa TaxID=3911 RepID=UPI00273C69DA|nr:uncharacterized protein LOC131627607 [Vicia villosa]